MLTKADILADAELAALAGPESDPAVPGVPYPHSQDQTILDVLRSRIRSEVGTITVDQLFAQLYASGEYLTLKQAQLAATPEAVMAFAVVDDATKYGKGMIHLALQSTTQLFSQLLAKSLISQSTIDALTTLATKTVSAADDFGVTGNLQVAAALGRGNPLGA